MYMKKIILYLLITVLAFAACKSEPAYLKTHSFQGNTWNRFDNQVFEIIKMLKPSGRGELEITDVNNAYIDKGELTYSILDGWWTDAGTFESLLRANNLVAKKEAK